MKRHRISFSLILMILSGISSFAQDTSYFDPMVNYYSIEGDSVRFDKTKSYKGYPKVEYAREVILLGDNSYKVEHCYYYDNFRHTKGKATQYRIIGDSVLIIDDQTWMLESVSDSLIYLTRTYGEYIERGEATNLVPLIFHGPFRTYNKDNRLLTTEHYRSGKCIKIESPRRDLIDSVYMIAETRPVFPYENGSVERYISKRFFYSEPAIESSIQGKVIIRFVVTSKGEVTNAEVLRGVDPAIDKEALKVVANLPDFKPAKLKGRNVNVYYVLPVTFILQ
ncbi:MAG: energy transducer TonB [Bacteroidales bacterium]|nr:energy transducer TonB [Bacteroidales bacterium]